MLVGDFELSPRDFVQLCSELLVLKQIEKRIAKLNLHSIVGSTQTSVTFIDRISPNAHMKNV
jgi:hypothetical protein